MLYKCVRLRPTGMWQRAVWYLCTGAMCIGKAPDIICFTNVRSYKSATSHKTVILHWYEDSKSHCTVFASISLSANSSWSLASHWLCTVILPRLASTYPDDIANWTVNKMWRYGCNLWSYLTIILFLSIWKWFYTNILHKIHSLGHGVTVSFGHTLYVTTGIYHINKMHKLYDIFPIFDKFIYIS